MVATAIYSVIMVLWKETAFPLWRAMERRWKRNVVCRMSSVIVVIRLLISCVSSVAISFIITARCYASAVLAMGLCRSVSVSVRLSQLKSVFYRNGWTNRAGFWRVSFFHPSYTVLKGNSVISKNKGTPLWNFVLNSRLRKFRHGIPIVETCYQLSSRKVDAQSVINWAVVGQLSR